MRWLLRTVLFLVASAVGTRAAEITAQFSLQTNEARADAPVWADVRLQEPPGRMRQGRLEFSLTAGGEVGYTFRTQEIVLANGDQRFRFLLPDSGAAASADRVWKLRFIEADRTLDLGEFPITRRADAAKPLIIGVVRGPGVGRSGEFAPWQALRVERMVGADLPGAYGAVISRTAPAFIETADLPVDPLGYFAYDAVLIEGSALGGVREKARAALTAWARAGGRLAVVGYGGIAPEEREWVSKLALLDPAAGEGNAVQMIRADYGRLLLASTRPEESVFSSPDWRLAVAGFWDLRGGFRDRLAKTEVLNLSQGDLRLDVRDPYYRSAAFEQQITSMLSPRGVRMVPVWLLGGVIGGLLFLIGPADWFILGWLRCHRLTWLLFPITIVACTAGMLVLARHFIGRTRQSGALVITDLGTDGTPVRETRVNFVLPPSEGLEKTELQSALVQTLPFSMGDYDGRARFAPGRFEGQYPGRYATLQPVRQWSPIYTRQTTLQPAAETSGVKWPALKKEARAEQLQSFMREMNGAPMLTTGTMVATSTNVPTAIATRSEFTKRLCAPPLTWSNVVFYRSAPSLAANLADLAVLEPEAPNETLLLAARRDGSTLHLWRRLYLH